MKFRVTSMSITGVGSRLGDVTPKLERALQKHIPVDRIYGASVDQFAFIYVAVDSDFEGNQIYCKPHNRKGRYKDIMTGETVTFISVAVSMNPDLILNMPIDELATSMKDLLMSRLREKPSHLPSRFELASFIEHVAAALGASS